VSGEEDAAREGAAQGAGTAAARFHAEEAEDAGGGGAAIRAQAASRTKRKRDWVLSSDSTSRRPRGANAKHRDARCTILGVSFGGGGSPENSGDGAAADGGKEWRALIRVRRERRHEDAGSRTRPLPVGSGGGPLGGWRAAAREMLAAGSGGGGNGQRALGAASGAPCCCWGHEEEGVTWQCGERASLRTSRPGPYVGLWGVGGVQCFGVGPFRCDCRRGRGRGSGTRERNGRAARLATREEGARGNGGRRVAAVARKGARGDGGRCRGRWAAARPDLVGCRGRQG